MALTPQEAWHKAAKLLAHCVGFPGKHKLELRKIEQEFSDVTDTHTVTFKLLIDHKTAVSDEKPVVYESDNPPDPSLLTLIREIDAKTKG